MSWTTRLVNAFRSTHVDADIDEELQFHLQERAGCTDRQRYSGYASGPRGPDARTQD